jgi:hypothetical protein
MKIFFLYHKRWEGEHAEPLIRISKDLCIECIPCESNPGKPELLWPNYDDSNRRSNLDKLYKKVESLNPDLILVHSRCITPYLLRTQIPLIILEHTDGTSLEISRHLIHLPQVLAVVKGSVFSNVHDYNSFCIEGMYHGRFINFYNLPNCYPVKKLSKKEIDKIILGYSFGCFPTNKRFLNYKITNKRNIDVSFVGSTNYERSRLLTKHRNSSVDMIKKTKNFVCKNNISQKEYDEILLNSKICLCPYGYGVCYRSFESIYAGCLSIQPYSDFMKTWPNVFVENEVYQKCDANFLNIKEAIEYSLDNYDSLICSANKKREELIECFFNNKNLCDYIYKNIIKIKKS